MIRLIAPYLIAALAAALTVAVGYIALQGKWLADAESNVDRMTGQLATCAARIENIREDMESDATVDDPSHFDVPDGWLMPEPGPGPGN